MDTPRISTFIYCNGFEVKQTPNGPRPEPSGLMQVITPPYIPGLFSLGIMFGILGFNVEMQNTFRFQFVSPEGTAVVDTNELPLPIIRKDDRLDDDMQGYFVNFDLRNINLEYAGEYNSIVFFNGKELGEFPIKVKAVGNNARRD